MSQNGKEITVTSENLKKQIQEAILTKHGEKIPELLEEARTTAESTKDYVSLIDTIASLSGLERTKEVQQQVARVEGAAIATEAINGALKGLSEVFGGQGLEDPIKVAEPIKDKFVEVVTVEMEEEDTKEKEIDDEPYDVSFLGN